MPQLDGKNRLFIPILRQCTELTRGNLIRLQHTHNPQLPPIPIPGLRHLILNKIISNNNRHIRHDIIRAKSDSKLETNLLNLQVVHDLQASTDIKPSHNPVVDKT